MTFLSVERRCAVLIGSHTQVTDKYLAALHHYKGSLATFDQGLAKALLTKPLWFPLSNSVFRTGGDAYWLTCTTFAGGKPLNQVEEAWL